MTKPLPVILIAEDEEDDYLLMRDAFLEFCVESDLRWVKDGGELLDYLLRQGSYKNGDAPRPGVILLDLYMPEKDSLEALREMKSNSELRRIPVVGLIASDNEEDVLRIYGFGVNSFIRKPAAGGEFVDVIKVFDKYWHETVQIPDSR